MHIAERVENSHLRDQQDVRGVCSVGVPQRVCGFLNGVKYPHILRFHRGYEGVHMPQQPHECGVFFGVIPHGAQRVGDGDVLEYVPSADDDGHMHAVVRQHRHTHLRRLPPDTPRVHIHHPRFFREYHDGAVGFAAVVGVEDERIGGEYRVGVCHTHIVYGSAAAVPSAPPPAFRPRRHARYRRPRRSARSALPAHRTAATTPRRTNHNRPHNGARGWHTEYMRLWDVSKILYYNTKRKPADRKVSLRKEESTVGSEWKKEDVGPRRSRYLVYFSFVTFLFFLAAVGIAYYVSVSGIDRTVSTSKITIVTQGPAVADGGTAVPLAIRVANRNPIAIQDVSLTVTYPPGSYRKDGGIAHITSEIFSWDMIDSGEVASARIAPILYGREGERKSIRYELRYLAVGSSQPTKVTDSYEVLLRSSPLRLGTPRHTTPIAGKEFSFSVTVQSNATETPPEASVELTYPTGFVPTEFSPRPFGTGAGTGRWRVPYLRPGGEFTVTVRGIIRGDERNEQSIIARAFAKPSGSASDDGILVAKEDVLFSIAKSFLAVTLNLDAPTGTDGRYGIVSPGDRVRGEVRWENQDAAQLENLIITAALSGTGLDESSIQPGGGGYFDEIQRNIIWDQQQRNSFSSVAVGEEAKRVL